jgi:hypothetical protein
MSLRFLRSFFRCFLPLFSLFLIVFPAQAANNPTISSRLNGLEAAWGHLRLGGSFSLQSDIYRGKPYATETEDGKNTVPGFQQELKVRLEAQATPELGLDMLLSHQGFWGVSMASDGNIDKSPLISPLFIDEAAIRYRRPNTLGDFGRFRFSLDPMGLITDHSSYPIEGIALQTSVNGVYIGGYYSRLSSLYQMGNLHVHEADDEVAIRIALPRPTYLLGITWLPNGLAHESAWSIDYTGWIKRHGFRMTAAHYSPSPDNYPEYNHKDGWGFLAEGDLIPGETQSLVMKLGYFESGFTPIFSRLANAVIDEGEPFSSNTQGIGLYYNKMIAKNWDMVLGTTWLKPVDLSLMTIAGRRAMLDWEIKAIHRFSPQSYLETGYKSDDTAIGRSGRLYLGINLQF